MEFAIKNSKVSQLILKNGKKCTVDPYKIVNFDGIWYLLARDSDDERIKTYMISRIKTFEYKKHTFKKPKDIEQTLENVHSAWFEDGESFKVKVQISKKTAHFFKRKKYFPTQIILQTNPNGSIDVEFEVSHYEDVDNLIKAWLPDIKLLSPQSYKLKFQKDLKDYLQQYSQD